MLLTSTGVACKMRRQWERALHLALLIEPRIFITNIAFGKEERRMSLIEIVAHAARIGRPAGSANLESPTRYRLAA